MPFNWHIETWYELEVFGGEPPVSHGIYYFLNELTAKRWSKKYGARSINIRPIQVETYDGSHGNFEGKVIRLHMIRPETRRLS